jgi:hypothetical protein
VKLSQPTPTPALEPPPRPEVKKQPSTPVTVALATKKAKLKAIHDAGSVIEKAVEGGRLEGTMKDTQLVRPRTG